MIKQQLSTVEPVKEPVVEKEEQTPASEPISGSDVELLSENIVDVKLTKVASIKLPHPKININDINSGRRTPMHIVVTGETKPFATTSLSILLAKSDYAHILDVPLLQIAIAEKFDETVPISALLTELVAFIETVNPITLGAIWLYPDSLLKLHVPSTTPTPGPLPKTINPVMCLVDLDTSCPDGYVILAVLPFNSRSAYEQDGSKFLLLVHDGKSDVTLTTLLSFLSLNIPLLTEVLSISSVNFLITWKKGHNVRPDDVPSEYTSPLSNACSTILLGDYCSRKRQNSVQDGKAY